MNETKVNFRSITEFFSSFAAGIGSEQNYRFIVFSEQTTGKDEVDAPGTQEEEDVDLCTYIFIDSRDQLLLNFSPQAIDVITEVYEVSNQS